MSKQTKTLRVRDKHVKLLSQMPFQVNQLFNHANELNHESQSTLSRCCRG